MGSFLIIVLAIVLVFYVAIKKGNKTEHHNEDESYERESIENEVYESESQRKERERQERYDEYVEKCLLLDAESGFRKMNEYNVLTVEQESWYENYVDNFCGMKVRTLWPPECDEELQDYYNLLKS